jgi:tetratricopeptide (TPR) repeat protein
MREPSLTERALDVKARNETFNRGLGEAIRDSASRPGVAREALARLENEAVSIESLEITLLEAMGPQAASLIAPARARWAAVRLDIFTSLARAEMLLGHFPEARKAIAAARSVSSISPDSPYQANIDFTEASINQLDAAFDTTTGLRPEDQFVKVFEDARRRGDWRTAAQAKMQSATAAMTAGRIGDFQSASQEAIDLAATHSLFRLEISSRISRLQLLLTTCSSGDILDQIRAELGFSTHLTGALPDRWGQLYQQASQAYAEATKVLSAAPAGGSSHPVLVAALENASRNASELDLAFLSCRLHDLASAEDIPSQEVASSLESFRRELSRIDREMRIAFLELAGGLKIRLNDPTTADEIRAQVNQLLASGVVQTTGVLQQIEEYGNRFSDLLEKAGQAIAGSHPQQALALATDALALAGSSTFRRMAINYCAMANFELHRFAEAEANLIEALAILDSSFADQLPALAGARDHRLTELEDLSLFYAHLLAKTGRLTEAWNASERGRAPALKAEIQSSQPGSLPDGHFECLRPWLDSIGAATVSLSTSRYGTLILSTAPGEGAPQAAFSELTQLTRLLAPDLDIGSQAWTSAIFGAIPELSSRLIQPIEQRLMEIARAARILYVIPYSSLYYVPFAALNLSDGRALAELSPLALAPSASVLRWSATRPAATPPVNCLLAAVGEDGGYAFSQHIAQVESVPWLVAPTVLKDSQLTKSALSQAASAHSVFYLSCHGTFSTTRVDGLAASELVLAQNERLNAREILAWKLPSSTVFLNACQSGRFRFEGRTEPNGFVRAFLLAGARSLISTLIHVDPAAAGEIAEKFFTATMKSYSPAAALREAQMGLKRTGRPAEEWAAHMVTGAAH